ncbi:MAG: YqeG family HAD IIIA-type phosphatase [Candidatus Melainabacteria bacterium]|nr:YqeG family HAD IIIA-type phosphatase [Candidatus Melainabacteria bacterium]
MVPFLKPTLIYNDDVTKVSINELKKLNIEGLILDLDNTIMAPKSAKLDLPVKYWLDVMKKNFKIVVLTNNKKAFYLEAVRQMLELPVIGFAKKPWSNGVKEALDILNLPNDKIAIIGDRPLTDIWLGQKYGFKTVLVRALTAHIEPKWKYLLRKLEWSFVKR